MIAVSFCTPNGVYPKMATKLAASLDKFKIPREIHKIDDTGSWFKALGLKPRFLLYQLKKHKQRVVWMDVDCEVIKEPVYLHEGYTDGWDFAEMNWERKHLKEPSFETHNPDGSPVLLFGTSCTFGVNYTPEAINLLERWSEAMKTAGEMVDDQVLDQIYNHGLAGNVKPMWLPTSYARSVNQFPEVPPVINHDYRRGCHRGEGPQTGTLESL